MQASILTIGDEILIGQVVDTNAAWLGAELSNLGITVTEIRSISDHEVAISQALDDLVPVSDLLLITGGLGPTNDDITKKVLAQFFNASMVFDEGTYEHVRAIFEQRGRTVSEINKAQAMVPDNCELLHNSNGTAKGMWFASGNTHVISMPGVPYEMKGVFSDEVLPRIRQRFSLPVIVHRTLLTQGVPESILAEKLASWEETLPDYMKLAYLPSPGRVRLRLTAKGGNELQLKEEVSAQISRIYQLLPKYIYGEGEQLLEQVVGDLLKEKGQTLSTAESCTGGTIAQKITSCSGSSAYFYGAVVAYDNSVKEGTLGVASDTLDSYGAVSEEVVLEMAAGVRKLIGTDWAVATSGVAGPDGGTKEKPVGMIWLAVVGPEYAETKCLRLGTNRGRNIEITVQTALNYLRRALLEQTEI